MMSMVISMISILMNIKMSYKRKGQLTSDGEWVKHLKKIGKRLFWKKERKAEKNFIKEDITESY